MLWQMMTEEEDYDDLPHCSRALSWPDQALSGSRSRGTCGQPARKTIENQIPMEMYVRQPPPPQRLCPTWLYPKDYAPPGQTLGKTLHRQRAVGNHNPWLNVWKGWALKNTNELRMTWCWEIRFNWIPPYHGVNLNIWVELALALSLASLYIFLH